MSGKGGHKEERKIKVGCCLLQADNTMLRLHEALHT